MIESKKKKSFFTFLTALIFTLLHGFLGLITTRLILGVYGSDFNGVNATANQFVNILLLLEGGFTLSTNVALFKPLSNDDENEVNRVLVATSKIFQRVGTIFLIVGIIASALYIKVINTEIPQLQVFLLFLFTIIPSAFNLIYTSKYAVLLQAEQKEYLINAINTFIIILTQTLLILVTSFRLHYLFIRIAHMTCSIIASITIVYICKKNNKTLNLHVEPNYSAIKGTKDVLIQKITGLIYGTVPVLYMSIFLGSVYVSVYAVYNSIFTLVKNILYSLVNAPRMSFGALIAEKDTEYVKEQFLLYEFIIVFFSTIIFCSALVMIIPFILLYTRGITDIEYNDNRIAIMLTLIGFVEIIHIPSGHIINMSGNFSYSKKFQLVAAILLIVLIPIASHYWGFIGILVSIFCAAIALAIMEIAYIHNRYFHKTLGRINRIIFSNLLFSTLLSIIELHYINNIDSYYKFFIIGFIVLLANSFILLVVNYLINRKEVVQVLNLIKNRIL